MKKAFTGIFIGLCVVTINGGVKEGYFLWVTVPERDTELRGPSLEISRPSRQSPREGTPKIDELVEKYQLEDLYTVVRPEGDLREKLYDAQAFDEVENALRDRFESIDDSMDRYQYGKVCDRLPSISAGRGPLKMKDVLDRWVKERPDSYYAALIRGSFMIEFAWYWRGSGIAATVTRDRFTKFFNALEEAGADLRRAMKLNPGDAEAPALMITVAMGAQYPRYQMEEFFETAVALAPDHFRACSRKAVFMAPKWGGDRKSVDAFLDECDRKAEQYPILGLMRISSYGEMTYSVLDKASYGQNKDEIVRRYDRVFERFPGVSALRAYQAFFLLKAGAYEEALAVFEMLDYTYYEGTPWSSVVEFARAHARSLRAVAFELESEDPEKARELLLRATEVAPFDAEAYGQLGNHYVRFELYDEALSAYDEALQADPEDVRNYIRLCWAYGDLGRYDEAIRYGEEALAMGPVRADVYILNKSISFAKDQKKKA